MEPVVFDPSTTRDIYLTGDIDEEKIAEVIQKIDAINDWHEMNFNIKTGNVNQSGVLLQSDTPITMSPLEDRITLHIMSYGGEAYASIALVQTMKASTLPVDTIAEGYVMSGGMLIFLSGDRRYTFTNTTHMWHHLSSGKSGTIANMARYMKTLEHLQKVLDDITIDGTCGLVTQEKLNELRERCEDWYLNGEEAIEYGFADFLLDKDEDDRDYVDADGNEFKVVE